MLASHGPASTSHRSTAPTPTWRRTTSAPNVRWKPQRQRLGNPGLAQFTNAGYATERCSIFSRSTASCSRATLVKVKIGDLVGGGQVRLRAIVIRRRQAGQSNLEFLEPACGGTLAWPGTPRRNERRVRLSGAGSTQRSNGTRAICPANVDEWVIGICTGGRRDHGTRIAATKQSLDHLQQTGNLRAVQILLGHTKIESTCSVTWGVECRGCARNSTKPLRFNIS